MSLKIMVVDNEPTTLQLLRSLAAPLGHTVFTFSDAPQAWDRSEKQRFNVFFLAIDKPDLDGLRLTARLRDSQLNRDTPILMLSSNDDIETLRTAFGEGADLVLSRPMNAGRVKGILAALDSGAWAKRHAARLPLVTEVNCVRGDQQWVLRSLNMSASGMLLQPSLDANVGEEVSLEFKLPDARSSVKISARIARKEGEERVGVEFVDITPEQQNAIQVYVTGRMTGPAKTQRDTHELWSGQLLPPR